MTMGGLAWVLIAVLANGLFLLKFYIKFFFNGDVQVLLNLCKMIPGITADNYLTKYLLWAIVPFNLLLASTVSVITIIVYKRVSNFFSFKQKDCLKTTD